MRYLMLAVLSVSLWCFSAFAQEDEEEEKLGAPSPVIAACLHKGDVYALTRRRDVHLFCALQRAKLGQLGGEPRIQKLPIPNTQTEHLFHIHDDTSFSSDGFLHFGVGLNATRVSNLTEKPKRRYWDDWTGLRIHPFFDLAIKNAKNPGSLTPDYSATKEASFAFTIDSHGKLFVFLAWKGRMSIWRGKVPTIEKETNIHSVICWDDRKEDKDTDPDPKPFRVLDTDIKNERFAAYQDKTHWFFVTESGRVLCLKQAGKDKRTECIWEDLRRPVRLLVEDNGTGKTWAFAPRKEKRGKQVPDVYFPLAKKIATTEYNSTKLPAWDLGKPLAMALGHARFLVKEKKVVIEEKKSKSAEKK